MRDRPNTDRLDALAMMFRCGADVPPDGPAVHFPGWLIELMGRGRRWAKTQMILEAAAGNTSRADRLDALARALNVPPQALEVEAANHYTAMLPFGGPPLGPDKVREWHRVALLDATPIPRPGSCYKVPCPPWSRALDEPDPCSIGDCLTCPGAAVGCGCRCHHGDEWMG